MAAEAMSSIPSLLPVKVEPGSTPTPSPPMTTTSLKQDPQGNSLSESSGDLQIRQQSQLGQSLSELRNLSAALSAFQRRYDELQEHLDFILTSINAHLPSNMDSEPSPPQQLAVVPLVGPSVVNEVAIVEQTNDANQASGSEIETLCKAMNSRGLRKYILSHLSDVAKLRREVPAALGLASNPAKLVLECSGRFFLQGSKAYSQKNSKMIPARQASVLILELFLLMGRDGNEIEAEVKGEAESGALAWKKRLINEGGVAKASEIDARGLLLFIGCFGIPPEFKDEDMRDLILTCNAREISDALRSSHILMTRIPEIIEAMVKHKMGVQAIDMACTFGLESRFSPNKILTSFLREAKETYNKARQTAAGSPTAMNEANKKELAALKSVLKCLEDHKMNPSKVLPGWQISPRVSSLEREIADLDKRIGEQTTPKRKADGVESSNKFKNPETKRTRFAGHALHQQNVSAYVDSKSLTDGFPGHSGSFSSSSILHGTGVGSTGIGEVLPISSYPAYQGSMLVDRVGGQIINNNDQPYGWHGDRPLRERLIPAATAVSGMYRLADPAATVVSGLYGPPEHVASAVGGLYRTAPTLEGFGGLPNPSAIRVSSRSSASDLYRFADAL
ncbi:hypothetical protein NMG60_11004747 [Bertholletia excelsa]